MSRCCSGRQSLRDWSRSGQKPTSSRQDQPHYPRGAARFGDDSRTQPMVRTSPCRMSYRPGSSLPSEAGPSSPPPPMCRGQPCSHGPSKSTLRPAPDAAAGSRSAPSRPTTTLLGDPRRHPDRGSGSVASRLERRLRTHVRVTDREPKASRVLRDTLAPNFDSRPPSRLSGAPPCVHTSSPHPLPSPTRLPGAPPRCAARIF